MRPFVLHTVHHPSDQKKKFLSIVQNSKCFEWFAPHLFTSVSIPSSTALIAFINLQEKIEYYSIFHNSWMLLLYFQPELTQSDLLAKPVLNYLSSLSAHYLDYHFESIGFIRFSFSCQWNHHKYETKTSLALSSLNNLNLCLNWTEFRKKKKFITLPYFKSNNKDDFEFYAKENCWWRLG